ncbi:MAG TPA: 16S rRNA (guanine(966)-N(2))-methyltransferase RsmD [Pyrinomonadaceae bacterium]|nr:16S rRNA (guanine(966)-N(2))-methyltransferase RsmD [Pyrinomonadaceae bacterium]
MENRRQQAAKPFNQRKYYDKDRENNQYRGQGKYPPREQSGSGGDRFQNRDTRGKFPPREGNDRYQSRDNRDSRENRDNRSGGDNYRKPAGGKYFSKGYNNKFQPKRNFPPKGKGFKPWRKEVPIKIVSDMQVTEGKHKGKYLTSSTSPKVRPTARRIREVMFRILYRRIRAGRFLDLCAGAGTVGIEAISRGALISTFVERSAKMCSFIKKNLEACKIKEGHGEIVEMEVAPYLKRMRKRRRFWDVVYFDPPYDSNYEEILSYLSRGAAIKSGGVLVIEHHAEMFFPEKTGVLKRWRVVVQGDTALSFYERK